MTLTQGLLALAGVVLAALLAHGLWLSWKARPRRAVAPGERLEPSLVGREMQITGSDDHGLGLNAPTNHGALQERPVRSPGRRRTALIEPLIDAVAELTPEAPLGGDTVLSAMPSTRRAGSKPLLIEGLNAESGSWEFPLHDQRYSAFQAGVQMANRSGPLNEIEYSEFVQKVQSFADALGASVDFADMADVVARARELDEFAHAHDAQLAVHLRAQGPSWTVGYVQQCAARHGMVPGPLAGQLVLPGADPDAPPLVMLTFDAQAALAEDPDQSALRTCTLTLDVPQSPESEEPFSHWQRLTTLLARDMEGVLMDDDGRAVSVQQFAAIHLELQRLYSALASRELAAGSAAAQRLFS
jgi:hypothetical protein